MAKTTKTSGSKEPAGLEVSEINLRILAVASAFASKDDERYYLQGVCVEIETRATTYIGTDGHRMICYREASPRDARDNLLTGAFIIPIARCKSYKLDKEDEGRATMYLDHGRLTIAHNMVDLTFAPIEGVYPNWRKAVPKTQASGTLAQYNFRQLDDFRKFADALELTQPFLAPNGDGPAFLWFAGQPNVFGIIMPFRSMDLMDHKPPGWALRGGPKRDQGDIEDDDLLRHPAAPGEEDEAVEAPPPSNDVGSDQRPTA